MTPTKSDLDNQHTNVAEKPDPAELAESFGGLTQSSTPIKDLLSSVPKGSVGFKDQTVAGQASLNNNNVGSYSPGQYPTHGIPYPANNPPHNYEQNYPAVQDNAYQQPEVNHDNPTYNYQQNYPAVQDGAYQLPQVTSHHQFSNLGLDPNLPIQPNVGYPPLQPIQYPNPHSSLLNQPKLPHDDGGTSVYASLSVDTEPQIAPFKVSLLGDSGALSLPKSPHADFHGPPQFANYLHGSLGGPLRVPLLSPMPSAYYWQSQGSLVPTSTFDTLDHFRKRNILQRRAFAKRLARYASLQKRLHRL